MIPKAKGHIYSYKDFTDEDLEVNPEETEEIFIEDLRKIDSISYMDLTYAELYEFVCKQWKLYKKDLKTEFRYRNKYFLQKFCVNFADPDDDVVECINKYTLSDWKPKAKNNEIDDRTLKIELFRYIDRIDSLYADKTYLVKSEHIYQLVLDLSRQIEEVDNLIDSGHANDLVNFDELNLYVLPIYILDAKTDEYLRISNFCYENYTFDEYYYVISDLYDALKIYVATNFHMLDLYNSNQKVTVYNSRKQTFSKVTFKAYASTATENKKVYSYVEQNMPDTYSPSIEISIDPEAKNVLAGNMIPRKLCDYRFSVRGHYTHVWKGKKGNQHREKIWVEPYEKNKDKPWKIIKETKLH